MSRASRATTKALRARELARRLGVSLPTAYRRIEAMRARQHDPEVLRVVTRPEKIGRGALREALHVLWPITPIAANDDATAND